ncbi:MAG: N-formylglutamate amidohydrolase [Pseudomonadota bacterium]
MAQYAAKRAGTDMLEEERIAIDAEFNPPFVVRAPRVQTSPFVFCSPHSGDVYPEAFVNASQLDPAALRKSEDCYVDELFAATVEHGAPLIHARFPRAYLDLNREPYELDPELFAEPLPEFSNSQTMRVVGGLGTIARIVSDSDEIYSGTIPLAVALQRIERLYKPFHAALGQLIENTRELFGYAVLVDCHSMPSTSSSYPAAIRPEFVIGDRFGTSCDVRMTRAMRTILVKLGHQVQLNRPYAGGFITEHYGQPKDDVHALQIEINRGLYLDEASLQKSRNFEQFQSQMSEVIARTTQLIPGILDSRAAAE